MKSTTGTSRRPAKARQATTRIKSKVVTKRGKVAKKPGPAPSKIAKQRAPEVAKKPGSAPKRTAKVKAPTPPPDEMKRQHEDNRQEAAASLVTVDWGPASHDHTPQELDLIVRKLRGGGPHDLKLARFGTTLRFSTLRLPGSRPAGADISQRVGRTVFFTIPSGFW
jgi:hypothetical protein